MIVISIRLPDGLLHDLEKHANKLHLSRTSYIREAITKYNLDLAAKERHDRLIQLSHKVRASSLHVNKEFSEKLTPRKGGQLKGLIRTSKDFDAPLPKDVSDKLNGD